MGSIDRVIWLFLINFYIGVLLLCCVKRTYFGNLMARNLHAFLVNMRPYPMIRNLFIFLDTIRHTTPTHVLGMIKLVTLNENNSYNKYFV